MFTFKMMFHFVLGFILFAEGKYVPGGGKVTSKVSPNHVDKGETATVTCHFPYDISQMTAVWVIVEHLPDNEPVGETVHLAECMKRNPSELKCTVLERGYVIENDVKTSLELRITNILARHSGFYRCLMVPPEGEILTSEKRRLSVLGGDKVTCNASPKQVKIGETSTVTCQFPYDASQLTTVWVTVDSFPAELERKEVDLVDCTKVNSQELKCTVLKEGYVIEGNVTTSLKLRITNISAQHSGRYRCQMVPPEGKRPKANKCRLLVFNAIPVPTTTERTIETSAGVESNGSDIDKETNSAVTSDVRDWLTVTAVIVMVLTGVVVIVVVTVLRNRRLRETTERTWRRREESQSSERGHYGRLQNGSGEEGEKKAIAANAETTGDYRTDLAKERSRPEQRRRTLRETTERIWRRRREESHSSERGDYGRLQNGSGEGEKNARAASAETTGDYRTDLAKERRIIEQRARILMETVVERLSRRRREENQSSERGDYGRLQNGSGEEGEKKARAASALWLPVKRE